LQDLALGGLGIAKVHHFVHEFVYDDEIIADGLFLEFLEVLDQDLGEAMEEEDGFCRVRVSF
jgi:hypothetical protein